MRNVLHKNCRENQNTHCTFNSLFFSFENFAVYDTIWKNNVEPGRQQMIVWGKLIACWTPKATNTQAEYVILVAFPLSQWLHERGSVLRYT
jgi:hypothetical protein